MKRLLFSFGLLLFTSTVFSQVIFDLGLKAGVNTSNLKVESILDIDSDSFTKMHWGAFGRAGFGRLYVQPEVYFSKKGGSLSSSLIEITSDFDYSNVDVPVLLGFKVIKGKALDFRLMAGPVFSFVTNTNYPDELDSILEDEFFNNHLMGVQYGLGVDVLFLTIDARMEHNSKIYDDPEMVSGSTNVFMLSVGFKIL